MCRLSPFYNSLILSEIYQFYHRINDFFKTALYTLYKWSCGLLVERCLFFLQIIFSGCDIFYDLQKNNNHKCEFCHFHILLKQYEQDIFSELKKIVVEFKPFGSLIKSV